MRSTNSSPFLVKSLIISFLTGLCFRIYSAQGGPAWTYWLSNVIMAAVITLTGLFIIIGNVASANFVRYVYNLKNDRYTNVKRVFWIFLGILLILFGGYMFSFTILQNINCRFTSC
jgi:hypothetical protein